MTEIEQVRTRIQEFEAELDRALQRGRSREAVDDIHMSLDVLQNRLERLEARDW
ncbi:hypothetical protein [Prauserella marina]|uniref:hypothetical protein n=1 Tax=Prauserella marina TaxID=530584 RepID=UPI001474C8F7|nr:hypothetical protein [Prauserella marina]